MIKNPKRLFADDPDLDRQFFTGALLVCCLSLSFFGAGAAGAAHTGALRSRLFIKPPAPIFKTFFAALLNRKLEASLVNTPQLRSEIGAGQAAGAS